MKSAVFPLVCCVSLSSAAATALAAPREWSDTTGKFKVKADLITFSDRLAVLQRGDKKLVAVPVDKLSKADQEFIKSKEVDAQPAKESSEPQTWTMRNGQKVVARVVDYARKKIVIQRRRGTVYVNDRAYQNVPDIYRKILPRVVGYFEKQKLETPEDLEKWVATLGGQSREYNVEGVLVVLENGDEVGVPFFFFSDEDLKVLKPGWDAWVAAEKDKERRENQALMLQAQAAAYQRDHEAKEQATMMKLEALAYLTGDLWEVRLIPQNPRAGGPLSVVVPARDSRAATQIALSKHPGYVAGPVSSIRP
jgi:hypothetical protein